MTPREAKRRKWLVPVVVKCTVWENATATVRADSEEEARRAALAHRYDDLEYDGEEIDRESEIDHIHENRELERVA